jgi:hypothetical protein
MLEEIASSRFGFWIVAFIIVLADSSFLLKPGKFAFSISDTNRVRFKISLLPFVVRNKELVSSLVSFPFQLFFISDIHAIERTARETLNALSRLRRLSRQSAIFSMLATCAAVLLILGPCIAALRGVQTSIITSLPPLYVLSITASLLLWRRRRKFGFSGATVLKISAEIVLCPVLLVNVSKHISLSQGLEVNALRIALLSTSPAQTIAAMQENIRFHSGE